MGERVFLVHGWSVQKTSTYQALHLQLARQEFDLQDIFLGRYVSLENEVEIRDIAKAMHHAFNKALGGDWSQPFHILTHSTGALVVRHWVVHQYVGSFATHKALRNLIFLAGPHFGSRLAHHGRSMLAHTVKLGDTGKKVLNSLELGSEMTWKLAEEWLDKSNWQEKEIRPYNLIGDRVKRNVFAAKIFSAGYETGSDMVVRVASGNLNFKKYEIAANSGMDRRVGELNEIPFAALGVYTHSGDECGIMNSIKKTSKLDKHTSLNLIIKCLKVKNNNEYSKLRDVLSTATIATRQKRQGYAQLVFRFRDENGGPVDDYAFSMGYINKAGKECPSKAVVDTHKNLVNPNYFTVFIKIKDIASEFPHFFKFDSSPDSDLFSYKPDPLRYSVLPNDISKIIIRDQTTLIDVIFSREPNENLFVFHPGNDPNLHVKWNRKGIVKDTKLKFK